MEATMMRIFGMLMLFSLCSRGTIQFFDPLSESKSDESNCLMSILIDFFFFLLLVLVKAMRSFGSAPCRTST